MPQTKKGWEALILRIKVLLKENLFPNLRLLVDKYSTKSKSWEERDDIYNVNVGQSYKTDFITITHETILLLFIESGPEECANKLEE